MNVLWRFDVDDRAISSTVTHALALGITAILVSGLLIAAGTMLEDQRENSAREQLRTVGNRIADELSRAAVLAQDGGNVTIRTRHPTRIAGKSYQVALLTGSGCDDDIVTTDTCLFLALEDGRTSVLVPVRNETAVAFDVTSTGTYTITATRNETAPSKTAPGYPRDLSIGVGDDIDQFSSGSSLNLTNRDPISGFIFTPGQPSVDSVIHFENDTKDLDGVITNYEWELGDGTVKDGVNEFNYSYASPGKYTVTLTVTDDDGETDNVSKVVSVGGLVYNEDASPQDVSASSPAIADGAIQFTVTNKHASEVTIQEVLIDPEDDDIDWLDAETGPDEIVIDADNDGGYDGQAEIYNGGRIYDIDDDGTGAADLSSSNTATVTFNGFARTEDGSPWTDMDGKPVFVAMRYEVGGQYYTAHFTLFGSGGGGNDPPVPDFTYSCTDRDCSFDGTGSNDPDGTIDDYEWDFGDGNTTSGPSATNPSNVFPTNGSFDVSLTVTDDDGVSSTLTKSVDLGGTAPVVVWAVNSGGDQYTDGNGITYDKDTDWDNHQYFVGPDDDDSSTGNPIANTSDDELYQYYRYGGYGFGYDVPVANGEYAVTFKLAEVYATGAGQRVFDVELEGTTVISDMDIFAEVGDDYALDRTRTVTVTDGTLDIWFEADTGGARSSAIVVRRTDAEAFQEFTSNDTVSMEAENYMGLVPGNDNDGSGDDMSYREWDEISDNDASGDTALDSPGNYRNAGDTENGERLDYYVDFDDAGTYYVFVRMECPDGSDDSVHVGLDGTPESYGDVGLTSNDGTDCSDVSGWTWVSDADNNAVTVDVTSDGLHTFNLWMREDGTKVDKIVLKKADSDPSGTGPGESPLG